MIFALCFLQLLPGAPDAVALELLINAQLNDEVYDERIVYKAQKRDIIRHKD